MIPKKLHFTYKTDDLPKVYQENLSKWKAFCPEWEIFYYSDQKVYQFFDAYFPHYSRDVAQVEQGVVLADLFRYGVLYIHGGMYTDMDTVPHKKVPEEWLSHEGVIGYEYQPSKYSCKDIPSYTEDTLCQWTLLSSPKHPLYKEALDESILRIRKRNFQFTYGTDILEATGPLLFTAVAKKYLSDPSILQLDMDVFAPFYMKKPQLSNILLFHQYHGNSGWKLEVALPQLKIQ